MEKYNYSKIYEVILDIIENKLIEAGYSIENQVVGQGGGLVVKNIDRDTNRFAVKASEIIVNGVTREVRKMPLDMTKASKGGRLSLVKDEEGNFKTIETKDLNGREDLLIPVYENGEMLVEQSLDSIRKKLWE